MKIKGSKNLKQDGGNENRVKGQNLMPIHKRQNSSMKDFVENGEQRIENRE